MPFETAYNTSMIAIAHSSDADVKRMFMFYTPTSRGRFMYEDFIMCERKLKPSDAAYQKHFCFG